MSDLAHAGRPHEGSTPHSGRYKWGSGKDPYQSSTDFLAEVSRLQKKLGMKETEVAEELGMNTTELRARKTAAKSAKREGDVARARQMREKGMSYSAIAEKLGVSTTTAKTLSEGGMLAKSAKTETAAEVLKANIKEHKYIEYGLGTEIALDCSTTQLKTAVQMLKDEGYESHEVFIRQVGTGKSKFTTLKVLTPPGTKKSEVMEHIGEIRAPMVHIDTGGKLTGVMQKPTPISSKRVKVVYDEDGGSKMDGVIELRRGVPELTIANGVYAQVRISVDGTHYLKGMAVYADDLPKGVDVRFNTNKKRGTPMTGPKDNTVLKPADPDNPRNPFGATVTQRQYKDPKTGKSKLSALNYVREEGDWDAWSRTLPSQYLSKQLLSQAKKQLKVTRDKQRAEFDEIMRLTNPVIKKKLLESFADECDAKAVSLQAAPYPRQSIQVMLPVPSMKPTEVYAPNYKHGERVALVRYPHAGTFEIPELTVNNRHKRAIARIGKNAKDAIGVHHSVAERLSGADFDGDFVLVVPNNDGKVRSTPPLRGLEGYDPKRAYPKREGMKVMKKGPQTQMQMGRVSNLITDMTIRGATKAEIARAVRHSMTVIDAAKHELDWQQSEKDNDIAGLRKKYQSGPMGGAATLVSRAKSPVYREQTRARRASEGGAIDPKTGDLVRVPTGRGHFAKIKRPDGTWETTDKWIPEMETIPKMSSVRDARSLSSGTRMEGVYADHANALKQMARDARLASLRVGKLPQSKAAKVKYAPEVESLKGKLKRAYAAKPRERQAQVVANASARLALQDNPELRTDKDARAKMERRMLGEARARTGARRYQIEITDREWKAIQEGAISHNMLDEIIQNTDTDRVRALATPKAAASVSAAKKSKIRLLKNRGYTNDEIAEACGMSASSVVRLMKDEGI